VPADRADAANRVALATPVVLSEHNDACRHGSGDAHRREHLHDDGHDDGHDDAYDVCVCGRVPPKPQKIH